MKKRTETFIDASKEIGLEINVETTKYMLLSRQQNVGQNWDIKIANTLLEIVSQFKYLRRQQQIKILFKRKLRGV
jgi:hypothetical protein